MNQYRDETPDPHALASVRSERDELQRDVLELQEENATLRTQLAEARAENERLRVSNGHLANQIRADRERYDRDMSAPAGKGVRGE